MRISMQMFVALVLVVNLFLTGLSVANAIARKYQEAESRNDSPISHRYASQRKATAVKTTIEIDAGANAQQSHASASGNK